MLYKIFNKKAKSILNTIYTVQKLGSTNSGIRIQLCVKTDFQKFSNFLSTCTQPK